MKVSFPKNLKTQNALKSRAKSFSKIRGPCKGGKQEIAQRRKVAKHVPSKNGQNGPDLGNFREETGKGMVHIWLNNLTATSDQKSANPKTTARGIPGNLWFTN